MAKDKRTKKQILAELEQARTTVGTLGDVVSQKDEEIRKLKEEAETNTTKIHDLSTQCARLEWNEEHLDALVEHQGIQLDEASRNFISLQRDVKYAGMIMVELFGPRLKEFILTTVQEQEEAKTKERINNAVEAARIEHANATALANQDPPGPTEDASIKESAADKKKDDVTETGNETPGNEPKAEQSTRQVEPFNGLTKNPEERNEPVRLM